MSEADAQNLSIQLEASTHQRLLALSRECGLPVEQLMVQVVERYLGWVDSLSSQDRAAVQAWQEYRRTGFHVSETEADTWLAQLEAGHVAELPHAGLWCSVASYRRNNSCN
ncbi:hypothetical protein [Massilia sp. BJB1822]|uniref:hypothetical protein n=1 Tax=Massilia sp. BJB1822 TaxID=2744470 RepID=UPI0015930284|nr:hypothetical protein [Massilia sp. BJB1822]NVD98606.1 hypothetical protein [Massilia sp. BJB1822]